MDVIISPFLDGLIKIYDNLFDGKSRTFLWIEGELTALLWRMAGFTCLPFLTSSKEDRVTHPPGCSLENIQKMKLYERFSVCGSGITTKVSLASLVLMRSLLSGMPTRLDHLWFPAHVHHLEEV